MTARGPALVGALVLLLAVPVAPAQQPPASSRPLRVRAQLERGPYYVGQSLALEVSVVAESERPGVTPPRVAGAEVTLTGTDLKPLTSAGIGDAVFERILYIARFRVLPRRAGLLTIPPVSARLGDRSGSSEAIRLSVQKLPDPGRTDAFLGGVGPFEVTAEARPATVRLGGIVEYCLRVTGPAARSMTRAPDARKLIRDPAGLTVEAGAVEAVADPPSRVFCYRVRPTRPGDLVLPPVSIAAFDPRIGGYVTRASPGVRVHVAEVPRFDPATLDYGARVRAGAPWLRAVAAGAATTALVGSIAAGCLVLRRTRARRRREGEAGRLLARRARALDHDGRSAPEVGRAITEGLAEYLQLTIGRPPGALTPLEAREAIARAAGDEVTGELAGQLISRCDRAQFGGGGPMAGELADEARRLFAELGRRERTRAFETPREAARTAPP